jgi:hypothetical protein
MSAHGRGSCSLSDGLPLGVTALWRNDGSGWGLLPPGGFLDEAALHEEAP